MHTDDDLIAEDEVRRLWSGSDNPISRPTLYRHIKLGRIPKPVHPTPGISRWWRSAIIAARAVATEAA